MCEEICLFFSFLGGRSTIGSSGCFPDGGGEEVEEEEEDEKKEGEEEERKKESEQDDDEEEEEEEVDENDGYNNSGNLWPVSTVHVR